jgi:hypothetical protein
MKIMRLHSAASSDRMMKLACGSVIFAFPLIFLDRSWYNINHPGTFRYNLLHALLVSTITNSVFF